MVATGAYRDEMTPLQRVDALIEGRRPDRVPCHPFLLDHAATVLGVKVSDYHRSAAVMARAQVAAWRRYGHDWVGIGPVLGIAESAGTVFAYPDSAAPYITEHAVKEVGDLDLLALPDPGDPRISLYLVAAAQIQQEIGGEVPVSLNVRSPFSTAANLRGAEELLRDIMIRPEFAHRLLRYALDATLVVLEAAKGFGIRFGTSDPVASGSLIGPRHYREFAQPYQKELIAAMLRISGYPALLHICGNTRKVWSEMADTGAGFLSLDDVVDLGEAKEVLGSRSVLTGNVRPTESMFLGTPETVRENVRQCLAAAGDAPGGFLLAVGCGLPIHTPPDNVHALMAAVREFGRYPLDWDALRAVA